jgi:hypothetical protein
MTAPKTFLIVAIVLSFLMVGCAKKPKQPLQSTVGSSSTSQTAIDSPDIFNEFYSDSAVTLDKAKNIKTFSLKPAKTAVPATESTPGYTPAFSVNGRYVIQVASMRSRWLADELATRLKEKGYPSYVLEVENPTEHLTGIYYRVRIGGFSTTVDAKAFAENVLVPAHFDYWVDRKANETSSPLESQRGRNQSFSGTSTYAPSAPPSSPPPTSYESAITQGSGTVPAASNQPEPSSTGGWNDSSLKW